MACECSEGYYDKMERLPDSRCDNQGRVVGRVYVPGHDCAYVAARKALIPEAAAEATHYLGTRNSPQWGAIFMLAMDKLWRARHAE